MPAAATKKRKPEKKIADVAGIGDLKPDPKNCRRHNPRNIGSIVNSLQKVGAARSIVIDEDNVILAGNGLVDAAGEAGITKLKIVEADGNTVIAVRRTGLTPKQKAELAIADNRTAELAEWDAEQLLKTIAEHDIDIAGIEFSEDEIRALTAEADREREVVEDEAPDGASLPERCKPGDLWKLGEHRLLCGDSTKAEDVSRLLEDRVPFIMVTDPPYGVEYEPEWREKSELGVGKRSKGEVENDNRLDWTNAYSLFPGQVAYVWHASFFTIDVGLNLRNAGFEIRSSIIWRKQHFAISRGHYHWQHEPCWYTVKRGATAKWCGDRTQSTTWDIANNNSFGNGNAEEAWGHGTQKPVECMARPIRNHGGKDDDVYDPFMGSGTTIIAAEQLGRRCYGVEIAPKYCDVILSRWEKLTSKQAERIEG